MNGQLRPLLKVEDLVVTYRKPRQPIVRAVSDVSFAVGEAETVGLVGESGSGKSSIGMAVLGLTKIDSGRICFDGTEISAASSRLRRALSSELQAVFQDPYGSLNPVRTVGDTLAEPLLVHSRRSSRDELRRSLIDLLARVGLPADSLDRYPNQFSGGQRQRIAIARALSISPRLIVCDEVVSALDLSVQAQVLNLLKELQRDAGLSYLFISHDLPVVRHVSNRIVVLLQGQVMEEGSAEDIYSRPAHPYTEALLAAVPAPDPIVQRDRRAHRRARPKTQQRARVSEGCPFAPRCAYVVDVCWTVRPTLERSAAGQLAACHRQHELAGTLNGGSDAATLASRLDAATAAKVNAANASDQDASTNGRSPSSL